MGQAPTVFFDGVCGLCNGCVDFILKHEAKPVMKFAALQSEYARAHLPLEDLTNMDSFIILESGHLYRKSDATIRVIYLMGGVWVFWSRVLQLVPLFLRNFCYDWIARRRYRFFGKRDACRVPTPAERARFEI